MNILIVQANDGADVLVTAKDGTKTTVPVGKQQDFLLDQSYMVEPVVSDSEVKLDTYFVAGPTLIVVPAAAV